MASSLGRPPPSPLTIVPKRFFLHRRSNTRWGRRGQRAGSVPVLGLCDFVVQDAKMGPDQVSTPPPRSLDPVCVALLDLAESEFRNRRLEAAAAVAGLARDRAPSELGPQRFLADAGQLGVEPSDDQRAGIHLARGKGYRLLGDRLAAEAEFRAALACDEDFSE